jgi:hypothetical protein
MTMANMDLALERNGAFAGASAQGAVVFPNLRLSAITWPRVTASGQPRRCRRG